MDTMTLPITPSVLGRFWSKVDRSGGPEACWRWTAARNQQGVGFFSIGGTVLSAHRFAYITTGATIDDGLILVQSCANRSCVNPAHLTLAARTDVNMRTPVREGPPESIYRARREALPGLALSEVARRAGMNKGQLSLIEQGRLVPTIDQAEAILSVLEAERDARR